MMQNTVDTIINKISERNPRHAKKIRTNLLGFDTDYYQRANSFFDKYLAFIDREGKDLDYGIDSYLRVINDVIFERIQFMQTGSYSCKSFADANARVYANKEVMDYYMHGLMISQFLWKQHYGIYKFFLDEMPAYKGKVGRYLEIGGGHGLYLEEAMDILGWVGVYDLVDISPSSIDMAKGFLEGRPIGYYLEDIYQYEANYKYDFITMGEVMEHVEDPVSLLGQIYRLLDDQGTAFVTAPANAPAIDHIYLFRSADHIREVIQEAGFKVVNDLSIITENVPESEVENQKVAVMYGAFIQKK